MTDTQIVSHDDVTRWFDGAARGIAGLLPENSDGLAARHCADVLAEYAHNSLEAAGVPRETAPEA